MKKYIPIFSITVSSFLMQNCTRQDQDLNADDFPSETVNTAFMMRGDSAKTPKDIVHRDPPVRDGDNWRIMPDK